MFRYIVMSYRDGTERIHVYLPMYNIKSDKVQVKVIIKTTRLTK